MARIDNLTNFLTDVATAIKNKTDIESIAPKDFDIAIESIQSGLEPLGLLKEYYVAAGQNVTPGTFIEFIEGNAYAEAYTSSIVNLTPTINGSTAIAASRRHGVAQLSDNKVLLAMNTSVDGSELIAVGLTFQNGTVSLTNAVALSSSNYNNVIVLRYTDNQGIVLIGDEGYSILFTNNLVSLDHTIDDITSPNTELRNNVDMHRCVCPLTSNILIICARYNSGHTYANGTAVHLVDISNLQVINYLNTKTIKEAFDISTAITVQNIIKLDDTSCIIIMRQSSGPLYALYCEINLQKGLISLSSLYTISTDSKYTSSSTYSGYGMYSTETNQGLFITQYTHEYNRDTTTGITTTIRHLRSFPFSLNGGTMSFSEFPLDNTETPNCYHYINAMQINDNQCVLFWDNETDNADYIYGKMIQYSPIIQQGTAMLVTPDCNNMDEAMICHLQPNSILFSTIQLDGETKKTILGQELFYNNMVLSNMGFSAAIKETQVQPTTSIITHGIAKTGGTGGTELEHKDKVYVYVPNV